MSLWIKGLVVAVIIFIFQILLVFLCGMFAWDENVSLNCQIFFSFNIFMFERGAGIFFQVIFYYLFGLGVAKVFSREKRTY
jgi:hypothetical protein